jgi:hypothetical protein
MGAVMMSFLLESVLAQIARLEGTPSREDSRAPASFDLTKVKRRRGFPRRRAANARVCLTSVNGAARVVPYAARMTFPGEAEL